jgi:beta-lactamase regulating signal transducer with metallopeptidase domain
MPALPPTLDPAALFVAGLVVKGTALLAGASLVTIALRRASAGTRHLVWAGGVAMLLVLPAVTGAVPWQLPVVVLAPAASSGVTALPDAVGGTPSAGHGVPSSVVPRSAEPRASIPTAPPSAEGRAPSAQRHPAMALPLFWATGLLLVLGRLGLGVLTVRRVIRAGADAAGTAWTHPLYEVSDRLGLAEAPRLVISREARMPFAAGFARPVIVLPADAAEWTDRRRRAVLCHELAHIRRRDLVVNIVAQMACAVWWFHPLAWLAARRLRVESERACDDLVLGIGTRPSEYANHLLQIVCRTANARTPAVALPMAQRREFEGRMLAILEPAARRDQPGRRGATMVAAAALACIVPLAALGARPATAGDVVLPAITAVGPDRDAVPGGDSALGLRRSASTGDSALGTRRSAAVPRAEGRAPSTREAGTEEAAPAPQDTTPRVVLALIRALSDSVESVRKDAAYALGRREARAAVAPLGDRAIRDPSADVREMAVWSLAQIGDRHAVTPIAAVLLEDAASGPRATAAWALGQFEDPASVTPLNAALLRDPSGEVRGRAAWALGQIEPRPAPPPLVGALRDSVAAVRYRAAWALGQIADAATVPALVAALREDPSSDTRKALIWAIGQMDGAAAQDGLLTAIEDDDPAVRAAAVRALAGGGGNPWPWPWPMPRVR